MRAALSTHVLDTSNGQPAGDVALTLRQMSPSSEVVAQLRTDPNGRASHVVGTGQPLRAGTYELVFETEAYFARQGKQTMFPQVSVTFRTDGTQHHHLPLLVSPFGFNAYRGS